MTRSVVKWGFAVALGLTAAGSATAQIISVPNPLTGGTFNYTRFNAMSLNVPMPGGGTFSYQRLYIGPPQQPTIVQNRYRSGYMSGGFGTSMYADPKLATQKQNNLAKAQKAGGWGNLEAKSAIADQWAYEKGAKPAALVAVPLKPKGVNPDLLAATPAEIASGAALDELLNAVRPLDEKLTRAVDSALLPPDLASRIVFAGPSADAVNLLRAGSLDFPTGLQGPEFAGLRDELTKEYVVLGEAATQNKATASAAGDRVIAAVRKARDTAAPAVREMAYPDAVETVRFFNRLDAAARLLKDPTASAAYVPSWSSIGLTVKELVRHMAKYKLTFGPATPADQNAYEVLHRGLVDYYLALANLPK